MEEAALNCISLSNPDIQKSVSLLRQVGNVLFSTIEIFHFELELGFLFLMFYSHSLVNFIRFCSLMMYFQLRIFM
ncbi:hypothetical protein KSP40_PGU015878 [Platanthera guangdongensis]|uniref:Uncharacterized protein n=1 Tax=Platanthera guangdongensis TaxID=2320717 RepID=A0ABR2N2X3_9ASPA